MSSRKIYIDASALYAFVDRADPNHVEMVKAMEQLSIKGMHLFTSSQAVQDAYNAISHQLGNNLGLEFLQAVLESTTEILYPQKSDLISAYKLLKVNRGRQVNLKEAVTAVLMQKKGISQILTFTYWQNLLGSTPYLLKI